MNELINEWMNRCNNELIELFTKWVYTALQKSHEEYEH